MDTSHKRRLRRPLLIVSIVGILLVALGGYATDVWAGFGAAMADTLTMRDTSNNTRARLGAQDDSKYGLRVWDSSGNLIYDFTDAHPLIASTVSALGSGTYDGETAYLRVGTAAPYEYVQLMWDATTGHWYTQPQTVATAASSVAQTKTNWNWILPQSDAIKDTIPNAKELYDAGLRPQVYLTAEMNAETAGSTISVAFFMTAMQPGNYLPQNYSDPAGIVSTSSSSSDWEFSGWQDVTFSGGELSTNYDIGEIDAKVSAATDNDYVSNASAQLRWKG